MGEVTKWIQTVFSEADGRGSASRVTAFVATLAGVLLAWVVSLSGRDIPPGAQLVLISAMGAGAAAYGANQLAAARQKDSRSDDHQ